MLNFIKKYSYDAVVMFVTQCAISIFGLVLALACSLAENESLRLFCSIGAILFYLFLLYTKVWDMGAKDKISLDYGHISYQPLKGLYISLIANSTNFVLAIGILLGLTLPGVAFFSSFGGICKLIDIVIQGMYTGLLAIQIQPDSPLNSYAFVYFLLPIPAMLTSWLGYLAGIKNFKIASLFSFKKAGK